MKLAGLWRLVAIGVALMAWLDPPVGVRTIPPVQVDVFVTAGHEAGARDLLDESASGRPAHVSIGRVHLIGVDQPATCVPVRSCLVIGEASDRVRLPADSLARVALVTVPAGDTRRPRVTQVSASTAHRLGTAQAVVTVESRGLSGARGRITLTQDGSPVGSADIIFTDANRIDAVVPWVPLDSSPAVLQASVEVLTDAPIGRTQTVAPVDPGAGPGPRPAERTSSADAFGVLVPVRSRPWPVRVHEARPSWATTFIRRALEADPRFTMAAATHLAPGVTLARGTASTPVATLTDEALDASHLVVVGGAEQLTADAVTRLDRFVRLRGGALVLVPDREWSGPITRLVPGRWPLAASAEPRRIGPLTGREWLLAEQLGPADARILAEGDIVGGTVTPMGHGLLMVSGALDAWRFRGDGREWNNFWVRLLADVAGRTPERLQVTLRAGDRAGRFEVDVRRRSVAASPLLEVAAARQCVNESPRPLRVWPGLHLDQYRIDVDSSSVSCRVTVTVGPDSAEVMVPVTGASPALGTRTVAEWAPAVTRAGGTVVESGAAGLAGVLSGLAAPEPIEEVRYPMRSPLWMIVLLGSLGLEWWLRRRSGGR